MSAEPHKTIVIGIGNLLFRDEGVGCLAALFLQENYRFTPEIEIIDGATLGFKLMPYMQEYDYLVILDTVSIEEEPGSVYVLPKEALMGLGQYRKTAHEVEVVQMMEICAFLEKSADTTVIGIIPEDIQSVEIGLAPITLKSFDRFIDAALKHLEKLGHKGEKVNNVPLKTIITSVSSPSSFKESV